jgi:predicted HAD superfamily Cof-like phosphohydrolase
MDKFLNLKRMKKLSKKKPLATNFDRVKAFMLMFGQEVVEKPEWPNAKTMELRIDLIEEELGELKDGILLGDGTLVDVADALTDLLYVIYGAGHSFGINLDKCFEEVHNSNMSKLGNDGKPIYREDGKILKGKNFREPNLKEVLNEQ